MREFLDHTSHIGGEIPMNRTTVLTKMFISVPADRSLHTHSRLMTLCYIIHQVSWHQEVFQSVF